MTTNTQSLRSLDELIEAGLIPHAMDKLQRVAAKFSVAITPAMHALIDPANDADPIAAQFIPSENELHIAPEERTDPIGDKDYSSVEGVVHRYPDRVLLKLLHICPVYCRFCFRREQIGASEGLLSADAAEKAFAYIADHPEIWEVILTGGDPLMLSDRRLADAVARLNAIPHVKVIRIHTRVPVVDPLRVTGELTAALRGRAPVYVLLHCNHARELTDEARAACARFIDAGIPMLSQSVLLRGVNDDAESLRDLMRAFVECRVKPHYLHHLDLARGTGHFRVPLGEAQELVRGMRGHLSGLCQPTLMLDIPGGAGKVPVGPVFARKEDTGWIVEDFRRNEHLYCETNLSSPLQEEVAKT